MDAALLEFLQMRFGREAARAIRTRWSANFGAEVPSSGVLDVPPRHPEYEDLLTLLLEHAADRSQASVALARWIAFSCMGGNHLWEDLGLSDRPELGRLMADRFPGLHRLNHGNMRWKKFFYRQLCERAQVTACRAPTCNACSEIGLCFGPELPRAAQRFTVARP